MATNLHQRRVLLCSKGKRLIIFFFDFHKVQMDRYDAIIIIIMFTVYDTTLYSSITVRVRIEFDFIISVTPSSRKGLLFNFFIFFISSVFALCTLYNITTVSRTEPFSRRRSVWNRDLIGRPDRGESTRPHVYYPTSHTPNRHVRDVARWSAQSGARTGR